MEISQNKTNINSMKNCFDIYETPIVEVIEVQVEVGFAASNPFEKPINDGNDYTW